MPEPTNLTYYIKEGLIDDKVLPLIQEFYTHYMAAVHQSQGDIKEGKRLFNQLVELVMQVVRNPYHFEIFHRAIRQPFDYYQFGLNFIRPLINFSQSKIFGLNYLEEIVSQLKKGENVILLANHQTEPDPQIISLLLEPIYPNLV